jgi:hypothetical protein
LVIKWSNKVVLGVGGAARLVEKGVGKGGGGEVVGIGGTVSGAAAVLVKVD